MADTEVATDASTVLDQYLALWGPYWTDPQIGVIVYIDNLGDVNYMRTVDSGENWASTEINGGTNVSVACWFDRETPGDTGSELHAIYLDILTGTVFYRSVDIAADTMTTEQTIDGTVTISAVSNGNRCAITKTLSGNLIAAFSTGTEVECYRSTDGFVSSNDDRADVYETATQEDYVLLYPANTGDDDDACAIFWDRSANEITLKMYDESGDSWTEFATPIDGSAVDSASFVNMDGSVRHSDNHVLMAWHTAFDNAADDLSTADLTVDSIVSPTITAKTDIYTNQDSSALASVLINQQTDDVYVAYAKGGTWLTAVDVVYHVSTDGMSSWGAEQAYSEAAAGDIRRIRAGRTVGNTGGRYQPVFHNDDLQDIFVNEVLDVAFGVVSPGAPAAAPSGSSRHRRTSTPLVSPEVMERNWQEQLAAAASRMAANYEKTAEAQWKARTKRVPEMSPERARVLRPKKPERYESVIYRKPERKQ